MKFLSWVMFNYKLQIAMQLLQCEILTASLSFPLPEYPVPFIYVLISWFPPVVSHKTSSLQMPLSFCRSMDADSSFVLPDVEDVKFVINFDYPSSSEDYVHRIGRTGRSQRTGTAYTFFTMQNAKQAADLVSVLKEANQVINPKLLEMADMSRGFGGGRSNIQGEPTPLLSLHGAYDERSTASSLGASATAPDSALLNYYSALPQPQSPIPSLLLTNFTLPSNNFLYSEQNRVENSSFGYAATILKMGLFVQNITEKLISCALSGNELFVSVVDSYVGGSYWNPSTLVDR
ncbi:putative ATP-dependent RNA helicase DDX5 [Frankliniella fusca]|uniref:ATP-dependent RNA helicase DDX5 n=1 Tax=Frankliniella fusca TaxID=407009 RepID=A0AAE1HIR2_9NEOP|nr:putative ATP-dependent RNA helicase DDX5 [Frankliniella fusca]